jgi:hypothetical protein
MTWYDRTIDGWRCGWCDHLLPVEADGDGCGCCGDLETEESRGKAEAFLEAQERLRLELERRQREAQERLEREARERAAEEQRIRDAEEADRRLEAALHAEAAGDTDLAEVIPETPLVQQVIQPEPVFTPSGHATMVPVRADQRRYGKKWRGYVTDAKLACKAIADSEVSDRLVKFVDSELHNLAKSLGGVRQIPGFDFREE